MKYIATADTDVGIHKQVNQDSLLIEHATYNNHEIMMAIICDGMGGLSRGELASAEVIRAFSKWFKNELVYELNDLNMDIIASKWSLLLKELNHKMLVLGEKIKSSLGTTFTGLLMVNDDMLIVHVGDTRVYHITSEVKQLTTDQTFIAREIDRGTMTIEEAKVDKRRNVLLQCIGASKVINPEVIISKVEPGMYILCSDGFRHEISNQEIQLALNTNTSFDKQTMHANARYLIDLVKSRKEKDNISVILINTK